MTTTLTVLSPRDIRNAYMRVVRGELIARGVTNPNVTDKSDYAVKAEALSQQIAPCMANAVIAADKNMPDTAVGDNLLRWLAMYGLTYRSAQPSAGYIVNSSSGSVSIQAGSELVDDLGQFYATTTTGTYANGAPIAIVAISTGASTNRAYGVVLQWVSPPAYCDPRVTVAVGGLINGADADTETVARNRLLVRMKTPIGGGNWAQTIAWAEEVAAGVVAYDYPALNGPSTYGLWCLGQLTYTGTAFTRQITDTLITEIANAVMAEKPSETHLTMPLAGAVNNNDPVDVSIGLSLPDAATAGGPGGGWLDQVPWPALAGTATRVWVSSTTSATSITVTSNAPSSTPDPATIVDGVTRISWFDPSVFATGGDTANAIRTSTIVAHSGTVGNVTLTLDPLQPFTGITAYDYIFPACENANAYALAWIAAVGALGPGEWTSDAVRLAYCRRKPLASITAPSALTALQTRQIENVSESVYNASYLYRSTLSPAIPANTTTTAPRVLVPGRRLAFYKV